MLAHTLVHTLVSAPASTLALFLLALVAILVPTLVTILVPSLVHPPSRHGPANPGQIFPSISGGGQLDSSCANSINLFVIEIDASWVWGEWRRMGRAKYVPSLVRACHFIYLVLLFGRLVTCSQ